MFSGSSSSEARLLLGFQAFSALFSLTSSLRDTVAMIFRGSFLWLCWERRGPKPEGWHGEKKKKKITKKTHFSAPTPRDGDGSGHRAPAQTLSSITDISGPDTAARRLDHHRQARGEEGGGAGGALTRPRLPMTGRPRLAKEGVKSGLQFMPLRRMGSSARSGVLLACEGTQG